MYKEAIIFAVGASVGAVGGYFFGKKQIEKKCAKEIEDMRLIFKKKEEEGETATEKLNNIKNYISEHYGESKETPDDAMIFVREESDEDGDLEQELAESEAPSEPDIREDPYPITPEDYFEGNDPGIGKRALIYYAMDDTLVDESSEEVLDISLIGVGNLEFFGQYEEKRLFIRNEPLGEDYEVIFEEAYFHPNDEEG